MIIIIKLLMNDYGSLKFWLFEKPPIFSVDKNIFEKKGVKMIEGKELLSLGVFVVLVIAILVIAVIDAPAMMLAALLLLIFGGWVPLLIISIMIVEGVASLYEE